MIAGVYFDNQPIDNDIIFINQINLSCFIFIKDLQTKEECSVTVFNILGL